VSSLQENNAYGEPCTILHFSKVPLLSLAWLLCKGCPFSSAKNAWPIPCNLSAWHAVAPEQIFAKKNGPGNEGKHCGTKADIVLFLHWVF